MAERHAGRFQYYPELGLNVPAPLRLRGDDPTAIIRHSAREAALKLANSPRWCVDWQLYDLKTRATAEF
jgi:hypothetical protein